MGPGRCTIGTRTVAEVERVIERSGVIAIIEERIASYQVKSGRPRELSVKALLVALLANAQNGELYLNGVPGYLNALGTRDRQRLGVKRVGKVTRRQVESLYGLICRSLRSDQEASLASFDEVCQRLLVASSHNEARARRDIAIDGTSIASWGTYRSMKRAKKGAKPGEKVPTDPDARWRGKGVDAWKRPVFGYDLTVSVTIPDPAGKPVPLAATSMRFRPAGTQTIPMALAVALDTAKQRGVLGDVLADREYTQRMDGSDFILPLRALGAEPVFQLKSTQQGGRGTQRGALVVDGQPYSPSLPESLRELKMPAVNATIEVLAAYQRKIGLREQYRLIPHGSRKADGSQVYQCPASAGKLRCALVASSQLLALGTMPAFGPTNPMPGSVCTKKFTTFAASELPLSQRAQYGSFDWYVSMNRRNRVEGFFGNLKDRARENVTRGSIRVMGLVKTGLLVAMAVASLNLRLGEKWETTQGEKSSPKKMGRPRKQGVAAYARAFAVASTGPPRA